MKEQSWQWIGRVSFESALIVFAVILGFLVNSWREEARAHAQAEAAFERIESELRSNRRIVADILPYHVQIAARLEALRESPPEGTLIEAFITLAPRGVGDVLLRRDAWITAQSRGALAAADFGTVQSISTVYRVAEEGVSQTWRHIVGQLGDREAFRPAGDGVALARLSFTYQTLISQERFLLQHYEAVLKELADGGEEAKLRHVKEQE